MEKYVEGSVSAIVSGSNQTEKNKKRLGKRKKTVSESNSQPKNVRFDCKDAEKDHVKYNTTPYSSSAKKGKKKNKAKKIENQKKLSFDEENAPPTKDDLSDKAKLVQNDKNKSAKKNTDKKAQDAGVVKKKSEDKAEGAVKDQNESEAATIASCRFRKMASDKEGFTIFVGNLPLSYDHKKVAKLFNKFGQVINARVRCVPVADMKIPKKASAITKNFNPKRNSANAYVVFKSKESVEKAVAENGMLIDGHHLRIDHAVAKAKDNKKSVFVGGLPFDVEDEDLWETFKDCGEIEDVRIIRDKVIGMGKGFGYVNFKSNASVELALKLDGQEVKNHKINVQRCIGKKKGKKKSFQKVATSKKKKKNLAQKDDPKLEKPSPEEDFQGRTAEQKKKKKKTKKSKDTLRKNKIKSALGMAPKKAKKDKAKSSKTKSN